MTPLYALSSSPTALPPPSVRVYLALLEIEAAPRLVPDATAPAFGWALPQQSPQLTHQLGTHTPRSY
ncbi:hypothetical protein E2562_017870 [Oryza meyeriana var. granulata]|uniref:Uncharacterized protein n=1 Tax=Oryza meyeriana var. granulata TaxID=110450 RepID=A0A6G1DZ78_9ORYZ|nr:hypothetical protein E2562_017870 [Oryza meyeriana var. granulata]